MLTDDALGGWTVERVRGHAAELHRASAELTIVGDAGRVLRVLDAEPPAIVLGSGQPETDVDLDAAAEAGVEVTRRRSGGGAVLVGADQVLWVDLLVPADDPLWRADIGHAAWWVGEAWAEALGAAGVESARVWKAAMKRTDWSSRVCFAGVAPGEVLIGDRKVVGVSQRRTRQAALFQTAVLLEWDPAHLVGLLSLEPVERSAAGVVLAGAAVGVGAASRAELERIFVDRLGS